jgi:hypothetical protein
LNQSTRKTSTRTHNNFHATDCTVVHLVFGPGMIVYPVKLYDYAFSFAQAGCASPQRN